MTNLFPVDYNWMTLLHYVAGRPAFRRVSGHRGLRTGIPSSCRIPACLGFVPVIPAPDRASARGRSHRRNAPGMYCNAYWN